MSGPIPPLPPTRGSSRVVPSAPLVPCDVVANNNSSLYSGGLEHRYSQVVLTREAEENQYEKLNITEPAIQTRLKKLEDNQIQIRMELRQFRDDIISILQLLQTSITEIKIASTALGDIVRESTSLSQSSLDKMQQRQLENSDHLGKQIMEVRRDIAVINRKLPSNVISK